MVKSGRVPGKGTICASIEKVSRRVPKEGRISVSTEKMVESVRVSKKSFSAITKKGSNQCEYRKMVESG